MVLSAIWGVEMASSTANRDPNIVKLITRLRMLVRKIEDDFIQQSNRIGFHHNKAENDYKTKEERLSTLILDKSLSNEKHVEYANQILSLVEGYRNGFIRVLLNLNSEIEKELAEFHELLVLVPKDLPNFLEITEAMGRWHSLSKEMLQARLMATEVIVDLVGLDALFPQIILKNNGRADIPFTNEETARFTEVGGSCKARMDQAVEDNQRLLKEREPLTRSFLPEEKRESATQAPSTSQITTVKPVHPLEGKTWFRLLKVLYILSGIVGVAIAALVAFDVQDFNAFLIGCGVVVVLLFAAKKIFYYIVLGRTTATEVPGKGFLDLEELRNELAPTIAANPDLYEKTIKPFFDSWKKQYGRRVPVQAVALFRQRIQEDINENQEKKRKLIEDAARKGQTLDLSSLRESFEQMKAEYKGSDREQYVRQLDSFIMSLEAKYGTAIPVDEANRVLEQMEKEIRKEQNRE